jgi:hypothetical protein
MPRPSHYIHGIRADDTHWTDAWNFSLSGTRSSIGVANALTETHVTPYEVDLEILAGPPQSWPPLFLSGFLTTLRLGSIVRAGGHVGQGAPPYETKWATPDVEAQILRAADRELALEAGRRAWAPSAPSRLCCLWLAEDSVEGRRWVQKLVGPQSFVMKVAIVTEIAWCRCDARWLDKVHIDPSDEDAIAGYWSGSACGSDPLWEHLIEGVIEAADPTDLQRLREFIAVNGPPADMKAQG